MKSRILFISGLFLALGFISCVEDDVITTNNQLVKTISVTGQDFQSEEAVTKATYTVDGTGMHFSWTIGDTVGIYPVGGDQVAFPISSGEGSQTAQFDGGAWALRSSYSYAAYFPFEKGNYMVDETQIPVSFIGQVQKGNGSLDCLDRFDYQASVATSPDADGNVNIELKHLGGFARFQFTMPLSDTYKSITLTSSKIPFVASGTFDLTIDDIAITPKSTSSSITISLNNTATTTENKVLTVYAMFAPTDLSDSDISISIEGTTYKSYSANVSGKNMIAGKAYSYSAKVQSGTNINGSDVEWDDEGQEIIQYEFVDLGLSVNWATCNVGASSSEDYGDYFAWGETEPYYEAGYAQEDPQAHWKDGKTFGYCLSNYKFYTGFNLDADCPEYSKYNTSCLCGPIDNNITLDPEDDVAHVIWGGSWRMPTYEEQDELCTKCTWTWYGSGNTEFNGVAGYKVTSNIEGYTDRFIFLPAAGDHNETSLDFVGSGGNYWSSSLDFSNSAGYISFNTNYVGRNNHDRSLGCSVRPVCSSEEWLSSVNISFVEDNKKVLVGGYLMLNVTVIQNAEVQSNLLVMWSSDDPSVAVVDNNGVVRALSAGIAHITASIQSISVQCTVTVTDNEMEIDHEYVDLGLSVKWATFNVGASKPEEYGGHYAWGEIKPKAEYYWYNYKWCKASVTQTNLTKYCSKSDYGSDGFTDTKTTLALKDDVAYVKWGGNWRMPTKAEQDDLLNNCTWTWYSSGNTEFNGVAGYKVISDVPGYEGRFIFLPAAGYRSGLDFYNNNLGHYSNNFGDFGYYWSSSLSTDSPNRAYSLVFCMGKLNYWGNNFERGYGLSVRPVCP